MIYNYEYSRLQEVKTVADNYATVNNLLACVTYIFYVSAVSPGGAQGSTETTVATMEEIGRKRLTCLSCV